LLQPNEHGDWTKHRDESFSDLLPLAEGDSFFSFRSWALKTNRDAWAFNSSKSSLIKNVGNLVRFYNSEAKEFVEAKKTNPKLKIEDFINPNPAKISWSRSLRRDASNSIVHSVHSERVSESLYRPYSKQWLYYDRSLIEEIGQVPKLFPEPNEKQLVICTTGKGASKDFSALIVDSIPNLDVLEKAQCFPLYYYEENRPDNPSLFDTAGEPQFVRRDGVSDFIAKRAKEQYGVAIKKEDIFYYVYGFLHSPEYRQKFVNDLKKMLPRIPLVDKLEDFVSFAKAGRKLADLHLNYESVAPHPDVTVEGDEHGFFEVAPKMRFPAKDRKDTILFNNRITVSNIPAKAYDYVINGKSAIEWIMERYVDKTDPASGIRNNANDWAKEVGNDRYILDLLLSIINVSVQTVDLVERLPKLSFEDA
jgi:predicted helicase